MRLRLALLLGTVCLPALSTPAVILVRDGETTHVTHKVDWMGSGGAPASVFDRLEAFTSPAACGSATRASARRFKTRKVSAQSRDFAVPPGLNAGSGEMVIFAISRKGRVERGGAGNGITVSTERATSVDWCVDCGGEALSESELKELGVSWIDERPPRPSKPLPMIWPPPPDAPVRAFLTRLRARGPARALARGFPLLETDDTRIFPARDEISPCGAETARRKK